MALINCSDCNNQISDKATICVKCGAPVIVKETISCFECSTILDKGVKSCTHCGAIQPLVEKEVVTEKVKKPEIVSEPKIVEKIIIKEVEKEKPARSGFFRFLKFVIIVIVFLIIAFVIFINYADKDTKREFFESIGIEDSDFVKDNAIETYVVTTEVFARQKLNGVWIINGWMRNTHTSETISSIEIRFNFSDGSTTETIYKTLGPDGTGQPFRIKIGGHRSAQYLDYNIIRAN